MPLSPCALPPPPFSVLPHIVRALVLLFTPNPAPTSVLLVRWAPRATSRAAFFSAPPTCGSAARPLPFPAQFALIPAVAPPASSLALFALRPSLTASLPRTLPPALPPLSDPRLPQRPPPLLPLFPPLGRPRDRATLPGGVRAPLGASASARGDAPRSPRASRPPSLGPRPPSDERSNGIAERERREVEETWRRRRRQRPGMKCERSLGAGRGREAEEARGWRSGGKKREEGRGGPGSAQKLGGAGKAVARGRRREEGG